MNTTKLEQKANQYAIVECGYNVDCGPDPNCEHCQWFDNNITESQMRHSSRGFKAGYQSAKHEDRWRSVDEELPEVNEQVLVKNEFDDVILAYYRNMENGRNWYTTIFPIMDDECQPVNDDILSLEETDFAPTHWKPIND